MGAKKCRKHVAATPAKARSATNLSRKCAIYLEKLCFSEEKFGGGGQSRTVDAADMSRSDSESNLLELLTELILEASAGGKSESEYDS